MRKPFWSWDNTLQRLGFRRVKKAAGRKPNTKRRMACEALEPREMLSLTIPGLRAVADTVVVTMYDSLTVSVSLNGGTATPYTVPGDGIVILDCAAGTDTVTITGTSSNESANLESGGGTIYGSAYQIQLSNAETVTVNLAGGSDSAVLTGTSTAETWSTGVADGTLWDSTYSIRIRNTESVEVDGAGGSDTAKLYDSTGNDTFTASPGEGQIDYASGTTISVEHFEAIHAYGTAGGNDTAYLNDSAGNDTLYADGSVTNAAGDIGDIALYGSGYYNRAKFFENVTAYATAGGNDTATMYDGTTDDLFVSWDGGASLADSATTDPAFSYRAEGFDTVNAYANNGGLDAAKLYDSTGTDTFTAEATEATLSIRDDGVSSEQVYTAHDFESVNAYATAGGDDTAVLRDSSGDDTGYVTSVDAILTGTNFYNRGKYFETATLTATSGNDVANFYDSTDPDLFEAYSTYATIDFNYSAGTMMAMSAVTTVPTGVELATAEAALTATAATKESSSASDKKLDDAERLWKIAFESWKDYLKSLETKFNGRTLDPQDFFEKSPKELAAAATKKTTTESDSESLTGQLAREFPSDSLLAVQDVQLSSVTAMSSGTETWDVKAESFDAVHAFGTAEDGGVDVANLYDTSGNDTFVARLYQDGSTALDDGALLGTGYYNRAKKFEQVNAYATGGTDTAQLWGNDATASITDGWSGGDNWVEWQNTTRSFVANDFDYVQASKAGVGTMALNAIANVSALEDDANDVFNLTGTFTSPTFQTAYNSNPTLVAPSYSGAQVTLDYQNNQYGNATIAVRGVQGSDRVYRSFGVSVAAVNDAPVLNAAYSPVLTSINEDITSPAGNTVAEIVANGSITDVDVTTVPEAIAITWVASTYGDWQYQLAGTSTWTTFTASTRYSRLLNATDRVRFVPDPDYNGSTRFTFRAWDQTTGTHGQTANTTSTGGTTAFSATYDSAYITVNAVNDAPVLNAAYSPVLTTIDEDTTSPAGNTVASIVVDGSITDPDVTPAPEAIAITSVDNANGDWQYQLSGTSTWTTFTATTAASRLLSANDKVRFVPDANFNGSANFTFRAWDQTTGTAGQTANTTSTGGTTAFSSVADTATITVTAQPDAPVLNAAYSPVLTTIDEDTTSPAGNTVASIVVNGSITDPDVTPAPEAIAITAVDNANGDWQYQLSGTSTWTTFTATTAASRLLSANDKVRFVPNANFNGSANFTFRAWDQTTGTAGQTANTTSTGGTTAFSSVADTATITVTAQPDAPVLNAAYSPVLTTIDEDTTSPAGNTVASIVVNGSITDPDVTPAPEAIAITSVDNANGDWQYQLSGTSTWTTFTATTAASRLLSAADKIRFVPDANYNGSASFTFRAWDQTTGTAGQTANTTSTGGTTAFSSVADTATITVTAVNDAPVFQNEPYSFSIAENSAVGTFVGQITATDEDIPAQTLTYEITAGNEDRAFAINPSTGQITVADQDALDYEATSSYSLTVRVTDNGSPVQNDTAAVAITVIDIHEEPVLDAIETAALSYTENQSPLALTGQLTVEDEDDTHLESATIQITGNFQSGEDVLAFTNTATITGSWNSTTGTLSLSGSATVAEYQAALRSVTYENTSDDPDPSTRTVSFTVNDGELDSNIVTRDVAITPVNDPPSLTVTNATVTTDEGTEVTNAGTFGDVDSATVTLTASVGTVTDNGDGTWSWSYTPADGPDHSQTVTITATDSDSAYTEVTFALVVDNVTPSLTVDSTTVTIDEGSQATNSGSFGDVGDDTVTLTASVGAVTDNGDGTWSWSYTPADGPDASQTVTITATDSDSAQTQVTFALTVDNVVPILDVTGGAISVVGEQYTLSLGATDPGDDTISQWRINWGDNTAEEVVTGQTTSVGHYYTAVGNYEITVTATDDDGDHAAAPLAVEALLGVTIDGPASIAEGSPYELMLDSGSLTITEWTIDWGDGTTDTLTGDPSSAEHTYADGDASYLITATASDGTRSYDAFLPTGGRPGELDTSFGDEGILATALGEANALAVQADGKFLVGGYQTGTNGYDFALTRYEADGSVDTTFGGTGTVVLDFAGGNDVINAVIVQPDGKILVAGYAYDSAGQSDFAMARYDAYGDLDTDFGTEGKLILDFDGEDDGAWSVALQSDGKIVVAGYAVPTAGQSNFALARFDAYGELDTDFGTDGTRITDFAAGADRAYALAIQPDDKIVVAGYANETAGGDNFALVRYEKDGALDGSFDADGMLTTDFAGSGDRAYAVAIQQDGKIVVAGRAEDGLGGVDFALARYEENGSLDTTFDADGMLTTDFGGNENYAYALAIQADGKIVVAGYTNEATGGDNFAMSRYEENGTLDTTFGTSGKLTTDFGSTSERANALAILPDGRILVAGSDGASNVALARYHAGPGRPVVVENVAPTLTVVDDQVVYEGQSFSLTNLAVFTDPGFDFATGSPATVETFSYSIDWGDNTTPTTGSPTIDVTGEAGVLTEGSFDGSHTYAEAGIYTVVVTISDDDGGSDVQSFVIHNGIPYAATGLSVTEVVSNTQVDLAWTDNAASELGFVIEKSTDGTTFVFAGWADADATSCSVTGLDPDTQYWLRVAAYNDIGTAPSDAVTATTEANLPLAPTDLAATAVAANEVDLSWSIDATSEHDDFLIELLTQPEDHVARWELNETMGANAYSTSSYSLTGTLTNGAQWTTAGKFDGAIDLDGNDQYIEVADSDLLDDTSQLTISTWIYADTLDGQDRGIVSKRVGVDDNQAYSLYFSADNKLSVEIDGSSDSFASSTVFQTGRWYHIAVTYDGSSPEAERVKLYVDGVLDTVAAETSSAIPNYASNLTLGTLNAGYSYAFDGKIDDTRIYNQALSAEAVAGLAEQFIEATWTLGADGTSATVTGLDANTEYTFRIAATNAVGQSAYTDEIQVLTTPETPTGLTATAVSTEEISLDWTAGEMGQYGFRVEQSTDGEEFTEVATTWDSEFVVDNLAPNNTYYFRVRAYNDAGTSEYSATASATTTEAIAVSDAPTSLTATPVADTVQMALAWVDNSNNEAGFRIWQSTDGTNFTEVATTQPNCTSWTLTDLDPDTLYYFRATAFNHLGDSTVPSNTATATTDDVAVDGSPTVATAAAAIVDSATGTAALSVLGADDGGEGNLTYTWAATMLAPGAETISYSANGTNAAKNATVTVDAAGTYWFTVTITDGDNLSTTSSVAVTVDQIPEEDTQVGMSLTPDTVSLDAGATQQFTVAGITDQFGDPVSASMYTWSATSGTIDEGGLYTAPDATGSDTVTVTCGSLVLNSTVAVTNHAPTVSTAAAATQVPASATAALSVLGADDADESHLTYTWAVLSKPSGADDPTFTVDGSENGTNAAKQAVATFTSLGDYEFQVTITDGGGLSVTDTVAITIAPTLTTIDVTPSSVSMDIGSTQQFTAVGLDQFGNAMATQPTFSWSTTAGSIDVDGLYTAPGACVPATVVASADGVSGSVSVALFNSSPTTSARTGDSWMQAWWEESMGSPTTRQDRLAQAAGNATYMLSTGFVVDPTTTFTLTDPESDSGTIPITPSTTNHQWQVDGVEYASVETTSSTLNFVETFNDATGEWTYTETFTLSYVIDTTVDGDDFSSVSGSYGYTFEASGDAAGSDYTFTATVNAPVVDTADEGAWSQTIATTDTIINNSTGTVPIGTHSAIGGTAVVYPGVSVDGYNYGDGDDQTFDYDLTYTWDSGSGTWIVTGTASTTKSDSGSTSDSYTDDYSDSGVGWSYSETTSLTSNDSWSYSYTTDYSLSGGTWQITGGSGSSSGDGTWTWNYNGDGNYWPADADDAMAGTFSNNGVDSTTYKYETTATYQDGHWTESGSGHVSDVGNSHYSYNGSGSYSNEIGLGSQDENGYENTSYSSTVDYVFDGGTWQLASGTAEYKEDRSGHWGYTTSAQSGDTTTTDTSQENGFEHYKIYYGLNTTTGLWKTTGAEANGNGNESWSRTVESPYSASGANWSVTGTSKQTQGSGVSHEYSGSGTVSGDDWSYSGTGWITSSTNSTYSYAGSGDYTDGTDTGTAKASGRDEAYTGYTTDYELDASDGTWEIAGRHKKSSGNGFTDWSFSISEDYTSGYITDGTRSEGGGNHTSYDYLILADRTEGSSWVYDEDESYTTRSHGTSEHSSYSGSGSYSRSVGEGTINGTVQEDGQSRTDTTYTTQSSLNPNGTWDTPTVTRDYYSDADEHWSYSGEGSYYRFEEYNDPVYSIQWSHLADEDVTESGYDTRAHHYDTTSTLGANGRWSTKGSGYTYSECGSDYSYSGSDTAFSSELNVEFAAYSSALPDTSDRQTTIEKNGSFSSQHVEYWAPQGGEWSKTRESDVSSDINYESSNRGDSSTEIVGAYYDTLIYIHDDRQTHSDTSTERRLELFNGSGSESQIATSHGSLTVHSSTTPQSGIPIAAGHGETVDEFGVGESGCREETITTYSNGVASTPSSSCTNTVRGSSTQNWNGVSESSSYGEWTISSPGYHEDHYHTPDDYTWTNWLTMTGHSGGGLSHSFSATGMMMSLPAESTLGELSAATVSLDASPLSLATPAATTSFGSLTASALFSQPVRTGGPSFGAVAATPSNAAFDAAGRLTSLTDGNAGVTRFGYDTAGNLASLTDPVENTTQWVYDEQDRVTEQVDPLGNSQYYTYNDAGDLVRYTDRNGEVCVYQYDGEHRVIAEIWYANTADADAGENAENTILYTYDAEGRITSEADDFSSTTYVYTDDGQLASVTESSLDGPTVVLAYQYNDAGLRTATSATIDGVADYVDEYSYDASGNLVSIVQHGIDGGNAVAEKQIDLAYNDAGQLVSVDRYLDGQLAVEADYSYDTAGRLIELVYHQGATILASYAWTYSDSGQWTVVSDQTDSSLASSPQPLASSSWLPSGGILPVCDTTEITTALLEGSYAAVDLLTSCTSIDGTATYSYDPTGQLVGVAYLGATGSASAQADEAYAYDANGNRITANGDTYVTGTDNQLLSDGTYWYAYDAEGNRTARFVDVNGDGLLNAGDTDVTQYAWDNRGRLVRVTERDEAGGDPTQVVDYLYDVENRWIGENIDEDGDGTIDRQLRFVYDGTQIVLQFETEGEGAVTGEDLSHRYLWQANAVDQLLADEQLLPSPVYGRGAGGEGDPTTGETTTAYDQSTPGQVLWPLTDHLGTVRDLAVHDAETGTTTVANHIVYDAYGRVTSETNAAVDSLFGFTGRPIDNNTGLQNNWNRWYDAQVGRWISEDPIGFEGRDSNTNCYAGNSPTNYVDPSGLRIVKVLVIELKAANSRSIIRWYWVPDTYGADPSDVLTGNSLSKESAPTADQNKIIQFAKGDATLEKEVVRLLNIVECLSECLHYDRNGDPVRTKLTAGWDTCHRFGLPIIEAILDEKFKHISVCGDDIDTQGANLGLSPDHFAIKVVIRRNDGKTLTFYMDQGALGGSDHIFFDFPQGWKLPPGWK